MCVRTPRLNVVPYPVGMKMWALPAYIRLESKKPVTTVTLVVRLRLVLLKMTSGDPLFSLTAILPREEVVEPVTIPPLSVILLANDIPVTFGRLARHRLALVFMFGNMPNMLLGRFVLSQTLVSPNVASGAILSGPKTTVPFVVSVGVDPYRVTRTGQPYVLTFVIMFSGLWWAHIKDALCNGTRSFLSVGTSLVQHLSMLVLAMTLMAEALEHVPLALRALSPVSLLPCLCRTLMV